MHEEAKKREYGQRVIEVQQGTFTPLLFRTNGGMGKECSKFLSVLAKSLAMKEGTKYGTIIPWLRTRIFFDIVRSAILCVRGTRTPFQRTMEMEDIGDFVLMNALSLH